MSSNSISPNHREGLTAQSTINGKNEYLSSTSGALNVSVISGGGGGTQYTNSQVVASGSIIGGVALGYDGTSVRAMRTDSFGDGYSVITDGNNSANIISTSAGISAGENALKTGRGYREIIVSGSAVGNLLPLTDVSQYSWVSIHITGTFSATYGFRGSNDNVNISGISLQNLGSSTLNPQVTSTASNSIFAGPLNFRYLSVPITAYTSGTLTATIELYTIAPAVQTVGATVASQNATGISIPTVAYPNGINSGGLLVIPSAANTNADSATGASILASASDLYNGASFDRQRNNTTGVVVAAGATTTQSNVTFVTYNAKRLMILVNITAGAGSVVVAINATSVSGYSTNLLTSTSLTGTGTTALRVFDGATPTANLVANDTVPRTVSITATVTGTITYGIDYILGI